MTGISFKGRVAIVTGAGGGIGRSHALELARRGCAVLVNDLGGDVAGLDGSASMAQQVVDEIAASGGQAIANHDSVARTAGAQAIVEQALEAFGRIDILINNAGIMRNAFLADTSDEDWDAVIATHLTGSFKMTRAVWPHMQAQGYGRIVFTASSAGLFGTLMAGGYGPAKAGVFGLMNVAAHEGRRYGILCNALMPNGASRMAAQAAADWEKGVPGRASPIPPEIGNAMNVEFNTPLAVYLASEACSSTHGAYSQCLGRHARVFAGATHGWQGQRQSAPSVEEVAAHWPEIVAAEEGYVTPRSPHDEIALVLSRSNQGPE